MFQRILLCIVLFFSLTSSNLAQVRDQSSWVDSCFNTMTLDEKIGQLFMIRAHSNLGKEHIESVKNQITQFHVGGLCFFQGTATKQAELSNIYQKLSKTPLMIAMDAEWGLGMRLKGPALSYPKQLTLGAIKDNTLIYKMGEDIANQLRRIGSHINFAPVVDVNNNPENPVIHNRSFGEDIYNVATKSYAYMKGLQDNSVIACAKHFPGHGDTNVDSHYDLPVISHNKQRLDSLELMPFRVLSQLGVKSMMSAHLSIPALDDQANRPSSLSHKIITGLLREQMNFEGLLFTDGLEMKGIAKYYKPGEMELEAIKAGNDILLLPIEIEKAFTTLKNAIISGVLHESIIDKKVKKILEAKYFIHLHQNRYVNNLEQIDKDINDKKYSVLINKLYEKAITLANDDLNLVPLTNKNIPNTASLIIGAEKGNAFQTRLEDFGIQKNIRISKTISADKKTEVINALRTYNNVIISLHDLSIYKSRNFNISEDAFDLIYKLNSQKNVILVIFGTPYALEYFNDLKSVIVSYEDNEVVQDITAQSILGVNKIQGKLPVTVNEKYTIKSGIERTGLFRLGYALPEQVGISSDSLLKIDTIVQDMLDKKASPGCQILAARNGKIFFHKSYGNHTPDGRIKVKNTDIYDVASVTKILATTISFMKLYDEGKVKLYEKLEKYLDHIETTNKASLILEDVLAHHAGLPGWIPFYERTIERKPKSYKRLAQYYREIGSDSFDIKVCNNLFLRSDWRDSIHQLIYNCKLRDTRDYRYSDLGFYLLQELIEKTTEKPLDQYTNENFYSPLNLSHTSFNPCEKFDINQIVPSEKDDYYRGCVLHGYVHDMGAAMLGGVGGHAGLFSNAKDIAVLMQMLLNGGSYGGDDFIKPQTVQKFTRRYYKSSRRGLGFDMKELDPEKTLNIAEEASSNAFGHLGFTGISVYADPDEDLIFIMLANRTYPSMDNYIFAKENYRPKVQSVFYNAIIKKHN